MLCAIPENFLINLVYFLVSVSRIFSCSHFNQQKQRFNQNDKNKNLNDCFLSVFTVDSMNIRFKLYQVRNIFCTLNVVHLEKQAMRIEYELLKLSMVLKLLSMVLCV